MNFLRPILVLLALAQVALTAELQVTFDKHDVVQAYAAKRLQQAFSEDSSYPHSNVALSIAGEIPAEGYKQVVAAANGSLSVEIKGGDSTGLLYGSLNLIEQLRIDPKGVKASQESARFPFRAIKFNLPFVSYRTGRALNLHEETCRDLKFWESFLDMMAENRFNSLTLWSLHPFHLMIRNERFPEACDLSDEELARWQTFWRALFALAKERGIDTYIVNWNVFVSPAFAKKHKVAEYSIHARRSYIGAGEKADIVKDYTRTTVTQLINTYPNLTGLGISLGERMGEFTPEEREEWILDTFVKGIQAADRPVRFIHRLPFSAGKNSGGSTSVSTEEMTRRAIESIKLPTSIITEAKFNWSHGHSTPKLIKVHGGKLGDTYWNPPPTNYKIHWMIRNEDFFALRWCEPDFIRKHIELNGHDYVGGYYVGSECYIPAKDYISMPPFSTAYGFRRQWLFYKTWGRLLYNPDTPDATFIHATTRRFGSGGESLFKALQLGSRMPLRLASFYNANWDFTLYSEGFMANSAKSNKQRFITVEEFIQRNPMEPDFLSIKDFVRLKQAVPESRTSPLQLANQAIKDGQEALKLATAITGYKTTPALDAEIADAKAWAHLHLHFGEKLKAAVALHSFREGEKNQGAIALKHLEAAVKHWEELSSVTETFHQVMPLAHIFPFKKEGEDPRVFHWKLLLPSAQAELQRVKVEVLQEK